MQRTLFISDLHLDSARPAVTASLATFLLNNTDCEALYVLGDLFEAWVGDDDDSALAADVAELFRAFTATGSRLYLISCRKRKKEKKKTMHQIHLFHERI